jgi:hypothetical protein
MTDALPGTSMLVSLPKQSVEHLVGEAMVGSSSASGEFGVGVGGDAVVVAATIVVGVAVGTAGTAASVLVLWLRCSVEHQSGSTRGTAASLLL